MESTETLKNKIDFAVILTVNRANPNGDPLSGNRPRTDYDGYGEISDVCIKRKIRNRLMDMGNSIFVQSDDNRKDEYRSLRSRVEGELKGLDMSNDNKFREAACNKWIDVRSFGQVFAYKAKDKKSKKSKDEKSESTEEKGDESVSIGIRGPVSVHAAFSIAPVNDRVASIQITKSVSGEGDGTKKASDTMGMKHRVNHGVYVFYGSINPQLAVKTFFTYEDAEKIKEALKTLFKNDESSARPAGTMEIYKLFWWKHSSPNGQYSSAKVHRLLEIKPKTNEPKMISDYDIKLNALPDLNCEDIDGE